MDISLTALLVLLLAGAGVVAIVGRQGGGKIVASIAALLALVVVLGGLVIHRHDAIRRAHALRQDQLEHAATVHATSGAAAHIFLHGSELPEPPFTSHVSVESGIAVRGLILMPVIAIIALALAMRLRRRKSEGSAGIAWAVIGAALLLGVGYFSFGVRRAHWSTERHVPHGVPTQTAPVVGNGEAEALFEQLTAPQISLEDLPPTPPTAAAAPLARGQTIAASPEIAAEVRQIVEESGLGEKIAELRRSADEAESDEDEGSSAREIGKYAKDAIIIMWLGDPTPFEALREAEAPDPDSFAAPGARRAEQSPIEQVAAVEDLQQAPPPAVEPAAMLAAASRPPWLNMQSPAERDSRALVLSSEPYSTLEECRDAIMRDFHAAVVTRIGDLARAVAGGQMDVPPLERMGIEVRQLADELVEDRYAETIQTSFAPMQRAHWLVRFTPVADEQLLDAWRAMTRQERIAEVGLGAGTIVGAVALLFGLLKIDTWTRGYYSKRLFLGVPAAIIGLIALLVFA